MSYIRREKKKLKPKEITGDQSVLSLDDKYAFNEDELIKAKLPKGIFSVDDPIVDLADDLETLKLLEEMEEAMKNLEDMVNARIDELSIPVLGGGGPIIGEQMVDPETGEPIIPEGTPPDTGVGSETGPADQVDIANITILQALQALNDGIPTSTLNGDIFRRAFDLTMDGSIHISGIDPLRILFNEYGLDAMTGMPLAPMPTHSPDGVDANKKVDSTRYSCSQLANHEDQADVDPETGDFTDPDAISLASVNTVLEEAKRITLWDLILKLMNLILYFIFKIPYDFLGKMGGRIVRRAVRGARNWCKKMMDKYYCYVTGECSDTEDTEEDQYVMNEIPAIDFPPPEVPITGPDTGSGLDCITSAASVMGFAGQNLSANSDTRAYSGAKKQRNYLEAMKHGEIMNIKNKEVFRDRIEALDSSTIGSPRDRRRFFGKRRKSYPW